MARKKKVEEAVVLEEKESKKEKKTTKKKVTESIEKESKLLKELPGEEKFQGISKINRFNILFVDLQIVFTIVTVICLVWYLFNPKVWHVLQFVLGITMFIIGYNNKIIYNRPKFAWVYYIIGAILIIFDVLLLLGV